MGCIRVLWEVFFWPSLIWKNTFRVGGIVQQDVLLFNEAYGIRINDVSALIAQSDQR